MATYSQSQVAILPAPKRWAPSPRALDEKP
jgi:hypothetical protein